MEKYDGDHDGEYEVSTQIQTSTSVMKAHI